nr:hypothetical protein [Tanacetum cinerariifolium]
MLKMNDSMTLAEYDLYMAMQCLMKSDMQDTTCGFTPKFFDQSLQTPNPLLDKKGFSLDEILDDLFRVRGTNLKSMEHEEVLNRCDEETVGDPDNESGNLPNFPTFTVTNEFARACIQDKEKEEAPMEDVEMDEDQDTDHLKTKEALQWSLAKDPSLVFMNLKDQSTFVQQITPSSISNVVKREFKILHRVFKIKDAFGNKQYKPEDIQELFHELFNDVQNILEELAEYINTPDWNRPAFCNNGDDDDEDCTIAVTPDFSITDSLIMENEHLDTISKTESDEFIKSSVENFVSIPSESEDFSDIESECDVPDCDDSQTTNFSTFSNPLFDDSTSSDDESSHEEVIHEMSFKTYSNPLFDLDEEIISSEFNPIHNEDLDSTPKIDRFDTKSYLLESLLNRDESIPLGIDNDDSDFEGDNLFLERLFHDDPIPLSDTLNFSYDV